MKIICSHCYAENIDTDIYCCNCGRKLYKGSDTTVTVKNINNKEDDTDVDDSDKRYSRAVLILSIIILIQIFVLTFLQVKKKNLVGFQNDFLLVYCGEQIQEESVSEQI